MRKDIIEMSKKELKRIEVVHHSIIIKINGPSFRTKNLRKKGGNT